MNMKASNPPPPPGISKPPPPPPPPHLGDEMGTAALSSDLDGVVVHLCQHAKYLSAEQKEKVRSALLLVDPPALQAESVADVNYDAGFDMGSEVEAQIRAVRAIRAYVFDGQGNIKEGVTSREAKEVISSGSTMLATLMKYHEKVMNMDRLRLLEQSVVEALSEIDPELRDDVMNRLEEKLEIDE